MACGQSRRLPAAVDDAAWITIAAGRVPSPKTKHKCMKKETENREHKLESVEEAIFTSEWAWAVCWVEQVQYELLNGDLEAALTAPQMCVLLEWGFRLGHRLGVEVARKAEIDKDQHNKIFDTTFDQCRSDFNEYVWDKAGCNTSDDASPQSIDIEAKVQGEQT